MLVFPVDSIAVLAEAQITWVCSRETFRQHPDIAEIYKAVNETLLGCVAESAAELGQRLKLPGTLPAAHCCFSFFPLPEVTLLRDLPLSLHA